MSQTTKEAEAKLVAARYGKTNVRVLRVVRSDEGRQDVVEYNVTLLVEGELEASYTEADNSLVVATDSMKNIIYALAKTSPYVLQQELFGAHIGIFIVQKYGHLDKAIVDIEKLKWSRVVVGGKEHAHSFIRDGEEKEISTVEVDASNGKQKLSVKISSGVKDLLLLKSTGSAFEGFLRDEYTTLVEVPDRILSTAVEYSYGLDVPILSGVEDLAVLDKEVKFGEIGKEARKITLEIFASDESASVQASLFKMASRLISENGRVRTASYRLPNKHYVPVDMRYLGIENVKPSEAEVFIPLGAPSGLISATLSRS